MNYKKIEEYAVPAFFIILIFVFGIFALRYKYSRIQEYDHRQLSANQTIQKGEMIYGGMTRAYDRRKYQVAPLIRYMFRTGEYRGGMVNRQHSYIYNGIIADRLIIEYQYTTRAKEKRSEIIYLPLANSEAVLETPAYTQIKGSIKRRFRLQVQSDKSLAVTE